MSIFKIQDIDEIFLLFCDVIDDLIIIKQLNKYYNKSISNNILFQSCLCLFRSQADSWLRNKKSDRLFLGACKTNNLLHKYLIKKFIDIDIHAYDEHAFRWSCHNGHLHISQWLIKLSLITSANKKKINIHAGSERAFRCSCENGHLHIAQWLIEFNSSINIHAMNEYAFRWSCAYGHLHIVQWLLDLCKKINSPIDIRASGDMAFRMSCVSGYLHIAQLLSTLSNKYVLNLDGKKINYEILE